MAQIVKVLCISYGLVYKDQRFNYRKSWKKNKERRKNDASKRNKRSTGNKKTNTNNDILENIQNSMNFDRQFETPSKNDC